MQGKCILSTFLEIVSLFHHCLGKMTIYQLWDELPKEISNLMKKFIKLEHFQWDVGALILITFMTHELETFSLIIVQKSLNQRDEISIEFLPIKYSLFRQGNCIINCKICFLQKGSMLLDPSSNLLRFQKWNNAKKSQFSAISFLKMSTFDTQSRVNSLFHLSNQDQQAFFAIKSTI